jgi:hypothetical protein
LNSRTKTAAVFCLLALAGGVGGCASGAKGVRFTDGGAASARPQAQPIRKLSAAEIQAAIVGKTFQYTRADGNGFVVYNADGTMAITDDTKGASVGRWGMLNGQYCEIFGPRAAQECGDFTNTGDAFFAAKSRLVEMKV